MSDRYRLALVVVLTGYDAALTAYVLAAYPTAFEANPIMAAAMGTLGVGTALAVRTVVGIAAAVALYAAAGSPRNRWGAAPLLAVAVVLTAVALWNTSVLAIGATYAAP